VDDSNPLAGVEDVFNAIAVRGDAVGDVMFYGRGAGKLPTASAVAADVIDIAAHQGHRRVVSWAEGGDDTVSSTELLKSFWYVRAVAGENALQSALGNVKMLVKDNGEAGETACLTMCELSRGELDEKLAGLDVCSVIRVLD
jgi:homoserine dehydrogenase